ncbi:MAG: methyltransferase domain-containing protein [Acidisphaera sp.]|nr:methyltransferase domain-containing protein [Acidisphaera sp.]
MRLHATERASTAADFPATSFASKLDFDRYLSAHRAILDQIYRHERTFATAAPCSAFPGTCAPCFRAANFTGRPDLAAALPDGRCVPDWRESMVCNCRDRLNARQRATLHFLLSKTGITVWTRVLALGYATDLDRRITEHAPRLARCSHLVREDGAWQLRAATRSVDVALASDTLHMMPPLDPALAEIRRVLAPGGQFVFTVPFRLFAPATVSRVSELPRSNDDLPAIVGHEVHEIGWDILDRLRACGFRRAHGYTYRSEELGYFGIHNMIFAADV